MDLGPNEEQTIRTIAEHSDEVQVVRTTGSPRAEIQRITTVAAPLESLRGVFRLGFDTSPFGGGRYSSGVIEHDAAASRGDGPVRTSLEEILEAMPNMGDVNVTRAGPDAQGGYEWTVTFDAALGDVPQLFVSQSALESIGADIGIQTLREGAKLGGQFRLSFGGEQSALIPADATEGQLKDALQQLPTVDSVDVRSVPPPELPPALPPAFGAPGAFREAGLEGPIGERGWAVTFTSDFNAGDLPALVPSASLMTGNGADVVVCVSNSTSAPCMGHSTDGNQLGGSFNVTW